MSRELFNHGLQANLNELFNHGLQANLNELFNHGLQANLNELFKQANLNAVTHTKHGLSFVSIMVT